MTREDNSLTREHSKYLLNNTRWLKVQICNPLLHYKGSEGEERGEKRNHYVNLQANQTNTRITIKVKPTWVFTAHLDIKE